MKGADQSGHPSPSHGHEEEGQEGGGNGSFWSCHLDSRHTGVAKTPSRGLSGVFPSWGVVHPSGTANTTGQVKPPLPAGSSFSLSCRQSAPFPKASLCS